MKPFIEFSFNGRSCADFHLVRVSDGSRYDDSIAITTTDTTATVSGQDGTLFFNSYHKQRTFAIQVAFDSVTETDLRGIRNWLSGKNIGDLIFGEDEDRIFSAKVQSAPTLKYVCFDTKDGQRVYKGEGTINFIAYYPYAHSVNKQIANSSNIGRIKVEGTVDAPFTYIIKHTVQSGTTISLKCVDGDDTKIFSIVTEQSCANLEWNSKTGMVVTISDIDDSRTPIDFSGESTVLLPSGYTITTPFVANEQLEFYNWYY